MDEILRKIQTRRGGSLPAWSPRELAVKRSVHRMLRALDGSHPPDALLRALEPCLPFGAAVVETIHTSHPAEPANLIYQVPDAFLRARAELIDIDPAVPFTLMTPAGVVVRDIDGLSEAERQRSPFIQALYPHFGFTNVSSFRVTAKPMGREQEHVTVWFFHERGVRLPTSEECRVLEALHAPFQAAMLRMRLPLLPHEPLRFQLLQEQQVGYILLRPGGAVFEANRRAVSLAHAYADQAIGAHRRSSLADFVERVLRAAPLTGLPVRRLGRPGGGGVLEAYLHHLERERYGVAEDVTLIELREMAGPFADAAPELRSSLEELPHRQREVAALLADSALSYKQIADTLGLSEGTIRKHTERLYRTLGVHSRAELVMSLKRRTTSLASP